MTHRYEEMRPQEFLNAVKKLPVFIIPTGLLEWHADHLPLGQDALKAEGICMRLAERLGGGIVLPPNYIGKPGYSSYTGTLTYSEGLVNQLFYEMFGQLRKVGARVILLLTGHYGHAQLDCLARVADVFSRENPDVRVIAQPEYEGVTVDGVVPADHAGLWETSMFTALRPELVRMDELRIQPLPMKIYENPQNDYYKEPAEWIWHDDVEASSAALGEKALALIVESLHQKVRHALGELGL